MTELTPTGRAALAYAHLDWRVLPTHYPTAKGCSCGKRDCTSPAKHPSCEHGLTEATADEETIRGWWSDGHKWGVAVACRASGLVVLDVDKHGDVDGEATLRELEATHGPLPRTCEAWTGGGGRHLFFVLPEGELRSKLGPGLDVRAEAYVLVEPSRHISGGAYSWERAPESCPPVELPAAWVAALRKPGAAPRPALPPRTCNATDGTAYGLAGLKRECEELRAMPADSGRNNRLNQAAFSAGQLIAGGELTESYAVDELRRAALDSGLGEAETEKTTRSGLEAGMREPRSAPPRAPHPAPLLNEAPPPTDEDRPREFDESGEPHKARDTEEQSWRWFSVGDQWQDFLALLDRRAERGFTPVPTGISGLDRLLGGGFERGQTALLCAPPGSGKTSMATDWALSYARRHATNGGPALYWSLEMRTSDIQARVVCLEAALPWNEVRRGQHQEAARVVGAALSGTPFVVVDRDSCPTIDGFEVGAKRLADRYGCAPLLLVDYAQLLGDGDKEVRQAMEQVSDRLRYLADRLEAAVLELSSVGRASYSVLQTGSVDLTRVLGMAKESGKWESDAAVVLGVVRVRTEDESPRAQKAWLACAKNRLGGSLGCVPVSFDGLTGHFAEVKPEDMPRPEEKGRDYKAEILAALATGPITSLEALRKKLRAGAPQVKAAVADLLEQEKIRRVGGSYRLPAEGAEP